MNKLEDIDLNTLDKVSIKSQVGIYFLYRGEELVYIGQTLCLFNRISTHIKDISKEFDSYKFIEINGNIDIYKLEREFIIKYKPKYNVAYKYSDDYLSYSNKKLKKKRKSKKFIIQINLDI